MLDVTGLSPVTDFMVIATGTSGRQMRSVCDRIEQMSESTDYKPIRRSGYEGEAWMVIDFVDVVVHIFNNESRSFYDLDSLWGDAQTVKWQR